MAIEVPGIPEINARYSDDVVIALRQPSLLDLRSLFDNIDEEALEHLSPEPHMYQHLFQSVPDLYQAEVAKTQHNTTYWGVYVSGNGKTQKQLLGLASLQHSGIDFDILLLAPESRGRGFGTRAKRLVMAAYFARPDAKPVIGTFVDEGDEVSLRMLSKVGMTEGVSDRLSNHPFTRWYYRERPSMLGWQAPFDKLVRSLGERDLVSADMRQSKRSSS